MSDLENDDLKIFNTKVLLLKKMYPSLDILMCETLLKTPEDKLDELYLKFKDNYPKTEPNKEEVLLPYSVKTQHYDSKGNELFD